MKKNNSNYLLFIFSCLFILSCQYNSVESSPEINKNTEQTFKYEVPPLMERSGKLAAMPEWASIWEEGQNIYQKVRQTADAQAALSLAALYMQEARVTGEHPYYYNAALDVLNLVMDNPPKEKIFLYQALVSKASVMLSQHQFSEALDLGKKALKITEKDAQVYGVLCDAYVELGEYDKAVLMADKMVSIKPDLRSYARISYLRELHGDIKGAIEAMKIAIKAGVPGQEGTAWARNTLANLYLEYGYIEEATQEIERCLTERDNFPFALSTKANLKLHQDKIDEAFTINTAATQVIPEFSFYATKAKIQSIKGQTQAYETTKQELLSMLKEDSESGHNMSLELADVYLDLFDNPKKALEILTPEYEKRPKNITVNMLMGKILYEMEDYKKALTHLEDASHTNYQKPSFIYLKAMTLYKIGKSETAAKMLKKIDCDNLLDKKMMTECKEIVTLNTLLSSGSN